MGIVRGGGGSSLSVPNDFIFASNVARDDYFAVNPSKLRSDIYVSVAGQLQKYVSDTFVDVSAVIKGSSGSNAPDMLIQYSANGSSGWSNTLNAALHKYWRWSTDNGVTWSPNYIKFSGDGATGGVPEPYSMSVSAGGKLQLFKDGELIQEQDETGAWIKYAVTTGTGSLHLGDLHSVGSAGENVIFKNEDSTLAWHPCWGAISADGATVIEQSARVHSGTLGAVEPVGAIGAGIVDYDSAFSVSGNVVFLYLDVMAGETYSGKCYLTVVNAVTGKTICEFLFNANTTAGNEFRVPFKYPLWMVDGQQFTTKITKEDGGFLQVRANSAGNEPWRRATFRTFTDETVFHTANAALQAQALNALTGADRLSANAIRDFPVMSSTVLGLAKLGTTMSINGDGELNTAVSPTGIKIVADQAARLSIPTSGGAIIAIQQDNGFTYGIEANQDTSVVGNWKQIGVVATNVVSFNGRNGAVVPATGDYNQKQIKTVHDDTAVEGFFGIDNNGIYWDDGV